MISRIQKNKYRLILGLAFLLGFLRLVPYFLSKIPLGYDPGIYIFLFHDYGQVLRNFDFSLLADRNKHEPLLFIFAAILKQIGISGSFIIKRGLGFFSLLPGFLFAIVFRKKNRLIGVISAVLYRVSIIQYEAFFRAYFKQIGGISFLIILVNFLHNKKNLFTALTLLILILLHRHTALYGILITVFYIIISSIREKKLPRKLLIFLSGSALLGFLVYRGQRESLFMHGREVLITTFGGQGMGGIFMSRIDRLKFACIPIFFSLFGVFAKIKNKEFDARFIAYFLGIIWIVFQLVNYNRTLIFLDIFVIALAATGLNFLLQNNKKIGILSIVLALLGNTVFYISYRTHHNEALISDAEFSAINSFQTQTPENSIIMLTHRNYTPWIMGYSGRDWISPGYSDLDVWTFEQRTNRRSSNGTVKCQILENYYSQLDRPIYLRLGSQQFAENLEGASCLNSFQKGPNFEIFKFN